jgi:beta-N-acetylhexosaminidase
MAARAVITSVPGLSLSAEARAFLRDADPWGFILFGYNIDTPAQVRTLVAAEKKRLGIERLAQPGDAP